MEPNRQSPSPSEVSESPTGPHQPPVECTAIVPCTPEHGNTNTNPLTKYIRGLHINQHTGPTSRTSTQVYSCGLSQGQIQKSETFRRSFGTPTGLVEVKVYNSMFTEWASWCSEWDSDPVSGDVSKVVSFLAHLFEGYQYRSLKLMRTGQLYPLYTIKWTGLVLDSTH